MAIPSSWARADQSTCRIATSQWVADRYRQHGLRCDGVVTPGISSDLLDGPAAASPPDAPPRFLYVGRLEPNKRVEWLLHVLARLNNTGPVDARPDDTCHFEAGLDLTLPTLRLIGDGPSRASCSMLARELGLASRVELLGAVPPDGVTAELRQADVFVFPSAYESFGIAALEALAVGLPVVASDLDALREATGGHAVLVPVDDLSAWCDALRRLLSDPAFRETQSAAGRAWAAQFTWDRVVDRFEPHVLAAAAH